MTKKTLELLLTMMDLKVEQFAAEKAAMIFNTEMPSHRTLDWVHGELVKLCEVASDE